MKNNDLLEYKDDYVKIANSTSRTSGASALNKDGTIRSVTARYVMQVADKNDSILDFGAGKDAVQAQALKSQGFENVTAYDFGTNVKDGLHDPNALSRQYDIVFASNVLNVSSDEEMLVDTLKDIWGAVKNGGRAIFNYPSSPRKAGFTSQEVEEIIIKTLGQKPKRVFGSSSAPVWELVKGVSESLTEGSDTHYNVYDEIIKENGYSDEEISKVISIADEYEKSATRGIISEDEIKHVSDLMGLESMSDSELRKAWDLYYYVLSRESFTDDDNTGIEKYKKYSDAASAFAEVINSEARKRKASGNYNPDLEEDIDAHQYDIGYVKTTNTNHPLVYGVSVEGPYTNSRGDEYKFVDLHLLCGWDYVSDWSDKMGWADSENFVDNVQSERLVCYDDQSPEQMLEEEGYEFCERPERIYHYNVDKDRWEVLRESMDEGYRYKSQGNLDSHDEQLLKNATKIIRNWFDVAELVHASGETKVINGDEDDNWRDKNILRGYFETSKEINDPVVEVNYLGDKPISNEKPMKRFMNYFTESKLSARDYLNQLDKKCLDEDMKFYDLRTLFEGVADRLTPQDKQELKNVLNSTDDPETIAAVLMARADDGQNESLSESSENIRRFEVGDEFSRTGLYGGPYECKVVSRTEDSVEVEESWIAEDTGEYVSDFETYPVEIDDKSNSERIVVWEYKGEKGYVYPNDRVDDEFDWSMQESMSIKDIKTAADKYNDNDLVYLKIKGEYYDPQQVMSDEDDLTLEPDEELIESENNDAKLVNQLINRYSKAAPKTSGTIYDEVVSEYGPKIASIVSKKCGDDGCFSVNEDYTSDNDDWGEPYSYEEVEDQLKEITNNFTDDDVTLRCNFEQEKNYGKQILMKHYKYVDVSDGRTGPGQHMSWVLACSEPIKEDNE